MRTSYCRGCDAFDNQDRYCHHHDDFINNIDDCDDYFNSDTMRGTMFPDGQDED